jgi:TonB family protein
MKTQTPVIRISVTEGEGGATRDETFNQKTIRIGKAGQAHLRLNDRNVSRQHAVIEVLDSGDIRLTDLESTNGTLLNGQRVSQAVLRPGDEIQVGATKMVLNFDADFGTKTASEAFYAPPVVKDEAADTDHSALEIVTLWNEEVVAVSHFPDGAQVTAGDKPGSQVFLPSEDLGSDQMMLVTSEGGRFCVDMSSPGVSGDCLIDGKVVPIGELERRGKFLPGKKLPMDVNTRLRAKFGAFTLMISVSHLPKPLKTRLGQRFNLHDQLYTIVSLILHLLFLILITLIPEEQLKATRDPYERRSQAYKMIQVVELEKIAKQEADRKAAEEEMRKRQKEKAKAEERKLSAEEIKRAASLPAEKGSGGGGGGPRTGGGGGGGGGGGSGLGSKLSSDEARARNSAIVDTAMTRLLGQQTDLMNELMDGGGSPGRGGVGGGSGIRVIGSQGGGGGDGMGLAASGLDAFGGSLGGGGGGGFRGTPLGGGGGRGGRGGGGGGGSAGSDEFGPADLKGLTGLEKGPTGGEGSPKVKFKESAGGAPVVYAGTYSVSGELDKDTVRRYIQTKMDQIRWCYQQEVQKNPDLAGQIVLSWVIAPTGKVIGVKISSSSMGNASVESCIASRISTWQFPSPRGGGTVRVNYPFIFRVTK